MYHVYTATLTDGTPFTFSCSSVRLHLIKEWIAQGVYRMVLGECILTTDCRNEARTYGTEL